MHKRCIMCALTAACCNAGMPICGRLQYTGYFHSRWIARTSVGLHIQGLQRIDGVTKLEISSMQASHYSSAVQTPCSVTDLPPSHRCPLSNKSSDSQPVCPDTQLQNRARLWLVWSKRRSRMALYWQSRDVPRPNSTFFSLEYVRCLLSSVSLPGD